MGEVNLFLLLGLLVSGERAAILFLTLVYLLIFIFIKNLRKLIILISTFSLMSFIIIMLSFPHYKVRMIDSTLFVMGLSKFILTENLLEAHHLSGGTAINKINSIIYE